MGPAKITMGAAKVIPILFAASTLNASSFPAEDAVSLGDCLIPKFDVPAVSPSLVRALPHLPVRLRQRQHQWECSPISAPLLLPTSAGHRFLS